MPVVVRLAARRDPYKRLKRYSTLEALAGAAVGLPTNGPFSMRHQSRIDAASAVALLGGLGAVLYEVVSTAAETPKTKPRLTCDSTPR